MSTPTETTKDQTSNDSVPDPSQSVKTERKDTDPKFFLAPSSSFQAPQQDSTNIAEQPQEAVATQHHQLPEDEPTAAQPDIANTSQTEQIDTTARELPPSSPNRGNQSGLFVSEEEDDDDEDEDHTEIDENYTLFESQIQAIIPEIGLDEVSKYYDQFKDKTNPVMSAVNSYYDGVNEMAPLAMGSSSPVKRTSTTVNATSSLPGNALRRRRVVHNFRDPRLSDPLDPDHPHNSSQPAQKRHKPEVQRKQLSKKIDWRRFIGQLQVTAWATRPTLKPLIYGTQLSIIKSEANSSTKGRGRGRSSYGENVSSYLKLVQDANDPAKRKEIGRMPEDIATILYPLIQDDDTGKNVDFDVTVVFCDGRLSTGDSFFIQVDCYLTSNIFKSGKSDSVEGEDPNTSMSGADELRLMRQGSSGFASSTGAVETPEEKEIRRRQVALMRLFNKLDFKVQESEINAKGLDEQTNNEVEFIDLSDDEQIAYLNSSQRPAKSAAQQDEESHELNLNQLKEFYKRTQTEKVLATLPETTPPSHNFALDLRSYQKQGLTWMLRNEREIDQDPNQSNMMNPLWKEFKFPKDRSWVVLHNERLREVYTKNLFYANLYSGEFSLEKPVLRSMVRGGILADEMGLGKTISTLSLIHYAPFDKQVTSLEQAQGLKYAHRTTLIIVPTSLLQQWQDEFDKSNGDGSSYFVYYGNDTSQSLPDLLLTKKDKDTPMVVFTTYGTVQTEWARYIKSTASSSRHVGLFSVKWFRVVLDEGHNIRNRMNKTTKACYDLKVSRKWLLTGTPIINRLDDLYSLVKFLELEPWSHISYWNTFITTPFMKKDYKQALDVVASILDPILLRRTKNMKQANGQPLVELPSKQVIIERIKFTPMEQDLYNWFLKLAETSVSQGIKRGDILKKYTQILVHILRLRQICCHMDLVKGSNDEMDEDLQGKVTGLRPLEIPDELLNPKLDTFKNQEELEKVKDTIKAKYPNVKTLEELECSICTTQPILKEHITFTECSHVFCHSCVLEHCQYQKIHGNEVFCPNCRAPIASTKLLQPKFPVKDSGEYDLYCYDAAALRSSKLNALLTHIRIIKDTTPGAKIVVFSQFSSYLDIMEEVISLESSTKVLKFHGKLSMEKRSQVLKEFKETKVSSSTQITVLLLSLKAGGVGLNLTEANTAFMCDPWWSPSVEDQAIDRIHRIGQQNNVKVIRFIMEGSIEEKMLKIQERKRTIGEAVEAEEEERRKRRVEEIQMLFE
ncbi:hypothetical protein WICPIJ_009601 [Wickerhamomyces pijperi]|uniref:DNA repair protein RAD5 n=1 Tax=Wickerhamomyces pijperi TaxID=599730 RepID=A0A9P8PML5_WICPI|nr:hypothetical protein WICPIJ_009601 [Wickerhamomyces pijperi]